MSDTYQTYQRYNNPNDKPGVSAEYVCTLERENTTLRAHAERLAEALEKAQDELNDLKSFYGKNLQVYGWHLNGKPEAFDNFITDNDCGATEAAHEALTLYRAENPKV